MAAISCNYKTIVLQAGEAFVLPPNSTLLGVSDLGSITTDCDTDNLEEPLCYVMEWALSRNEDPSVAIEAQDYDLYFVINGVEYLIINELGAAGPEVWLTSAAPITAVIPAGVLTSPVLTVGTTGDRISQVLTFSTIPSIAAAIKIKIITPDYDGGLFVFPVEQEC